MKLDTLKLERESLVKKLETFSAMESLTEEQSNEVDSLVEKIENTDKAIEKEVKVLNTLRSESPASKLLEGSFKAPAVHVVKNAEQKEEEFWGLEMKKLMGAISPAEAQNRQLEMYDVRTDASPGQLLFPELPSTRLYEVLSEKGEVSKLGLNIVNLSSIQTITVPIIRDDANDGEVVAEGGASTGAYHAETEKAVDPKQIGSGKMTLSLAFEMGDMYRFKNMIFPMLMKRLDRQEMYHRVLGTYAAGLAGEAEGFHGYLVANPGSLVSSASAGVISYDDLVDVETSLKVRHRANAKWIMGRSTWGTISKLVDNQNRPLLNNSADITIGINKSLLGYPVVLVEELPGVATGNLPILFGDFNEAVGNGLSAYRYGTPILHRDMSQLHDAANINYVSLHYIAQRVINPEAYNGLLIS